MSETAGDIGIIDLHYLGFAGQVCSAVVPTRNGFVLVDCGPGLTLPRLLEGMEEFGLSPAELRAVLLTHIHLDHAGAAGALSEAAPQARIFVHGANGAPHLLQPEKLLKSAKRLYGERLDQLFGAMQPVPPARVEELAGGETLDIDGRRFEVIATPGHASHHLAYLDAETRVVFAGDAAGLREPGMADVLPYTPPPDIELNEWRSSLERIRQAKPDALMLTHFGQVDDPQEHLALFEKRLFEWSEVARSIAAGPLELEEAGREFLSRMDGAGNRPFQVVADVSHCGQGLVRYWRKSGMALPAAGV